MVHVSVKFDVVFDPKEQEKIDEIFEKFNIATILDLPIKEYRFGEIVGWVFYRKGCRCMCDFDRFNNLIEYLDSNDTPHVEISIG